ncbi:MAG: YigZ family protein [Butyrivibrio sp.]|nr:YigZ family protein [Butyrivibrio sp.]
MTEHIIVKHGGEGVYEEKKSRFIARLYGAESESEAVAHIEAARKKYWDARHTCYAFVIGENNELTRCSDDKEPSGTAGKPILEVITKAGIHNCLVTVTRYFGGTLLGTGGLVRAYTKAAKEALRASGLALVQGGALYRVVTDYNGVGKIRRAAAELGAQIRDTAYSDKAELAVAVTADMGERLCTAITESTNGRAAVEKVCDLPIETEYRIDI